jgi:hypothetical protein
MNYPTWLTVIGGLVALATPVALALGLAFFLRKTDADG